MTKMRKCEREALNLGVGSLNLRVQDLHFIPPGPRVTERLGQTSVHAIVHAIAAASADGSDARTFRRWRDKNQKVRAQGAYLGGGVS